MWKLHLAASISVLALALLLIFYTIQPFSDSRYTDLILDEGSGNSVRVEQTERGMGLLKLSDNQRDISFALGYLAARDRSAQLTLLQTALKGELAFNLGREYLWHDVWVKSLNLPQLSEEIFSGLSKSERNYLTLYSAGINACYQSANYEISLPLTTLGFKPEQWQPETVLQALIFFIVEINRQPTHEEFLNQAVRDAGFADLAAKIYPGLHKKRVLFNSYHWELFPRQESLFYPPSLLQSDILLECDNSYYFTLYSQNSYPNSFYPLQINRAGRSELQLTLAGLPLTMAAFSSKNAFYLTRGVTSSKLLLKANHEIADAQEYRFSVKLNDQTPEEFRSRHLADGFLLSQTQSGSSKDSSLFFYLPTKKIAETIHTLLNLKPATISESEKIILNEMGLDFVFFTDNKANRPFKTIARRDFDYLPAGISVTDRLRSDHFLNDLFNDSLINNRYNQQPDYQLLKKWHRFYEPSNRACALFNKLKIGREKKIWQQLYPAFIKLAAVYPLASDALTENYYQHQQSNLASILIQSADSSLSNRNLLPAGLPAPSNSTGFYLELLDSVLRQSPKELIAKNNDLFKILPAFWYKKRAEIFLPSQIEFGAQNSSYRRQNSQLVPAVTIKISPLSNQLEYILMSGATEDPNDVLYNFFYTFWQRKLFLPLENQ